MTDKPEDVHVVHTHFNDGRVGTLRTTDKAKADAHAAAVEAGQHDHVEKVVQTTETKT